MKVEVSYGEEYLDRIARFRVRCYENSAYAEKVNFRTYPNGLTDELDTRSNHFLVLEGENLVGSARLTLLNSILEIPYIQEFNRPNVIDVREPFWFYSRLAVDQSYRRKGVGRLLDQSRFDFMRNDKSKACETWMIAKGWRLPQLIQWGCEIVQSREQDTNSIYPFSITETIYLLKAGLNE